ncbi:glycoside hydrolase family 16 protein [Sphingomonas crusticola]|uniref:glycoside hydrolase family 16 protein n=1 Tax=Sphingomonas crusticola TaxID=1697973 RepID=UPI000E257261|nr:glycoside hydrolase family 16 protein [Sphingomonas crusticola]
MTHSASGDIVFRRGIIGAALLAMLVAVLAVGWQRVSGASPATPPLNIADYRLTFAEEFDSLDLSAWGPGTRWIAHTPWKGDFGDARFLDPGPNGPAQASGGVLSITMRRGADGKWGSGLLASVDPAGKGFTQSGGYFEMRAQFPEGAGVWPAFWLASLGAPGDLKPEVDAVEYYGQDNKNYYVNLHLWQNGKDLYQRSARVAITPGMATSGFHLYGVSVAGDFVTFYLDRQQVAQIASRPEFMQPMMMLANLAAGGGWPIGGIPDPSTMQIDYIRAYQPNSAG